MSNKQHINLKEILFHNLVRHENYLAARELGFFKRKEVLKMYDKLDEEVTNNEIQLIKLLIME